MEIHTCLWNDVAAFDFGPTDLTPLTTALSDTQKTGKLSDTQDFSFRDTQVISHRDETSFLASAERANVVLTWDFPATWYAQCPNLEIVMTPAAGTDWVEPDPNRRVKTVHGRFHGSLLAESLLSAILFMNHQMPAMLDNFNKREWDRNLQTKSRLLSTQTVLIIGMGNIGTYCANIIATLGTRVIGIKRNVLSDVLSDTQKNIELAGVDDLPNLLPIADHVVLLLPGTPDTEGFMHDKRLQLCKPNAYIYNFGRGNALRSVDLINHWDRLGGAFLDVIDEEPLPPESPLWQLDNIMITPHSSCVYADYRGGFIQEVIEYLGVR